jgi:hypothetical protein
MEDAIAVGDRLRLNTKMIETVNRKWGGTSLLVEVVSISTDKDGLKLLSVREVNRG